MTWKKASSCTISTRQPEQFTPFGIFVSAMFTWLVFVFFCAYCNADFTTDCADLAMLHGWDDTILSLTVVNGELN